MDRGSASKDRHWQVGILPFDEMTREINASIVGLAIYQRLRISCAQPVTPSDDEAALGAIS